MRIVLLLSFLFLVSCEPLALQFGDEANRELLKLKRQVEECHNFKELWDKFGSKTEPVGKIKEKIDHCVELKAWSNDGSK